jgi:hypothetical protein
MKKGIEDVVTSSAQGVALSNKEMTENTRQ